MKPINLLSLVNAKNKLDDTVFQSYKSRFGINIRDAELSHVNSLVSELHSIRESARIVEGFYVGYRINQISKEFDLLRFGEDNIINIELKRKDTKFAMIEQLLQNKYYLGFVGKKVLQFTYVVSEKKLYHLNEQEEFVEVEIAFLFKHLKKQSLIEVGDINEYFSPSQYLVSPFNSTERFLENGYFLTEHQQKIKDEILSYNTNTGPSYISIEGHAGTGKTLLTYDIAKAFRDSEKRVLIIHCGSLNDGQQVLRNHGWEITPIKDYEDYNVSDYDIIIIDETQRIYTSQLEEIINAINDTNIKCIFSYDPIQCLSIAEVERNIPQLIKNKVSPEHHSLTGTIRVNKELSAFIKNLFDVSKGNPNFNYTSIDLRYFANRSLVSNYLRGLSDRGWKAINYTPGYYSTHPYQYYQNWQDESVHNVIGQEFDNVVVVIDSNFVYDGNLLTSKKNYSYDNTKMLYQMVTRARNKLHIVIIDNEEVLEKCLRILKPNRQVPNQDNKKILENCLKILKSNKQITNQDKKDFLEKCLEILESNREITS
ncbi:DUF2075 domain-containing protein [Bacillus cereus]|uniref:DNA/RNA helicase domain-containing protein n=1 Tax=Bacillus cereus TaxID=1396 RepID=UPI00240648E4|nr:DNA/RNA helicase domain-containing protein [Bacillus cereus]MDF9524731.1 DUF2075 domain-containing protein [Bacillus cereus]MDF9564420.1 DUF2075 domain-containing protein [Bacillus cereus]